MAYTDNTMLTVSLHGITLRAPHGLYPQEHVLGNDFEIDIDVLLSVEDNRPWPFADYTLINETVRQVFNQPGQLLETFVQHIHAALKAQFTEAAKIKVAVRKLRPPMAGDVQYAQVCFEG